MIDTPYGKMTVAALAELTGIGVTTLLYRLDHGWPAEYLCGPRHRFCVFDRGTGKLRIVSNCTQAIARDILTEAMWRLEKAGFEIVGHVHDEVIIEAPIGKYTPEDICKIMAANPRWCMDLPLAAAGYRGDYYFKD